MKIGLYFGSFNPIHVGHYKLADYLIENQLVDEVWFVVSPCNPLKKQSDLIDERQRLEMVKIAIKDNPKMKASDIEFGMPVPSYTIDTLKLFSEKYPEYSFCLIIGSDNALLFDRWKNFKTILENYSVLVYPRKGYDFEKIAALYPQMQLVDTPYYDISSTEIRKNVGNPQFIQGKIDANVYEYTLKHKLYVNFL